MQDPATFDRMKAQFPELEQLKCPRCDSTNTKFCYYNNYNLSQPRHFCKNCRRYWTKGGALRNIPVGGGTRKSNTKKRHNLKPDPDPSRANPTGKSQETSCSQSVLPAAAAATSTSSQEPVVTVPSFMAPGIGTDPDPRRLYGFPMHHDHKMLGITGSFSSLLASNGSVLDGIKPNGSGFKMVQVGGFGENFGAGQNLDSFPSRGPGSQNHGNNHNGGESFMQSGGNNSDSNCWSGGGNNGWPDLAIYTPSSNYQ